MKLWMTPLTLVVGLAACQQQTPQVSAPEREAQLIVLSTSDQAALESISGLGVLSFKASGLTASSTLKSTALGDTRNLALEGTRVGDILVSGVSPSTPFGLIRKVTAVNRTTGLLKVESEQATLADAIKAGKVPEGNYRVEVPVRLQSQGLQLPMTPRSDGSLNRYGDDLYASGWTAEQGKTFSPNFSAQDIALIPPLNVCSSQAPGHANDLVQVCANASASLIFDLNVGWRWAFIFPYPYIDSFSTGLRFSMGQTVDTTLTEVNGKLFNKKGDLIDPLNPNFVLGTQVWNGSDVIAQNISSPIVFFIGVVPVVLVPSYALTWDYSGTVTVVPPTLSIPFGATFTMGLRYQDGQGWSSLNGADPSLIAVKAKAPTIETTALQLKANAKAGITGKMGLYLYGIYGPEAGVGPKANIGVVADFGTRRIKGTATLSLSAYAGLYGDIMGLGLLPQVDFFRWEPAWPYPLFDASF